jgi:hypothetical protein
VPSGLYRNTFLARDESQLEYCEKITKDMPGKVLSKHSIAERDDDTLRLSSICLSLKGVRSTSFWSD